MAVALISATISKTKAALSEKKTCVFFAVGHLPLFAKGPRSEYSEVARGHDLANLETGQAKAEVTTQQATRVFQAKAKEARKKKMEAIEEMSDLAAPCSWLCRLEATTHLLVVLEPFIENTLMVLPKRSQTHFLHAHNFVHTDIKPPNIGLKNLTRSFVSQAASCPPPARRLTAIILDIDSIIPIPANGTTIPAQPGTNGTIGFHSPEQERIEFDGTADIWALGVSFHEKYSVMVRKVGEKRCDEMAALLDFIIASFRFSEAAIESQKQPRPSSAECRRALIGKSEFLRMRAKWEEETATRNDIT
ncbi:hypothetical protein FOXB_00747 [Fusarium oxysporum f. sp. conglutinans Fo5176]|uniref:Protein kinase domain-containing protein n=1 Tax=Fusarium oxysporum (strain Fo5176) TaxID=660025 RepID=F9F2X2_FUSOF|nr:hypothetical protein FOXB_00747 [Fusarium oxysporum f. sp. conglutinans Fo5176]